MSKIRKPTLMNIKKVTVSNVDFENTPFCIFNFSGDCILRGVNKRRKCKINYWPTERERKKVCPSNLCPLKNPEKYGIEVEII